jgi:3-deoxy-7-phosphoheptulonate synthase
VDTRIKKIRPLIPPACLLEELPTPVTTQAHIIKARLEAHRIIQGRDDRLIVVIGPCSIHDPAAALEYAKRLQPLAEKYKNNLHVVSRHRGEHEVELWCQRHCAYSDLSSLRQC